MKVFKYLKMRFFCSHKFKPVENSSWYFHMRCEKCGCEKGLGNFKYK